MASLEVRNYIRIETKDLELLLGVAANNRLYQLHLGKKLNERTDYLIHQQYYNSTDGSLKPLTHEVYSGEATDNFFETSISIRHTDGGISTELHYVSHSQNKIDDNVTKTEIILKDSVYNVNVKLNYKSYYQQNIFVTNAEITNDEDGDIELRKYLSGAIYFVDRKYVLNEFTGDCISEFTMTQQKLQVGRKTIASKFATRANMFASPFFELGLGGKPKETEGTVVLGHIAWTGNFAMNFDVDATHELRILCGVNPVISNYYLKKGKTLETPDFIYTISYNGSGQASRNFHDYGRIYRIKDGLGPRMTLLNNWETTYFDFNEWKLANLMREAKRIGVDMFLLDDGWFGNKYPRNDDTQGLGDWEPMYSKLPNGLQALTRAAREADIKFGLWVEPEMVNPKSELMEKHPDWATLNPDRTPFYHRNQLVLDLSNPEVQDFIFNTIDKILSENPDIVYLKWDCNSVTTNLHSKYLQANQSNYFYDYTQGFYKVMERITSKHPNTQMMLCSGGSGRCDYKVLEYFTEFWASDNTDPIERIYIQYGASKIFPAKAMSCHVTEWNRKASYKFRVDVAMQGKFGFDIDPGKLSDWEREFFINAVKCYNYFKPAILEGDLYRLVSPYSEGHAANEYISKDGNMVVVFAFDLHPRVGDKTFKLQLQGLDPNANYYCEEINLTPGSWSQNEINGKVLTGDFLMNYGFDVFSRWEMNSHAFKVMKQY